MATTQWDGQNRPAPWEVIAMGLGSGLARWLGGIARRPALTRALRAIKGLVDKAIFILYLWLAGIVITLLIPGPSFTTPGFAPLHRLLERLPLVGPQDEALFSGLALALLAFPLLELAFRRAWWIGLIWRLGLGGFYGLLAWSFATGNPHSFGWSTYLAVVIVLIAQALAILWERATRAPE